MFLRRAAHARPLDLRALAGAAALGGVVGLTIGGAYLAGGMARAAVVHAQIARLADVAEKGFSDAALTASQSEDPGALSIARRLDPYNAAEFDPQARNLALVSRLESSTLAPRILKASYGQSASVAEKPQAPSRPAKPYVARGALDETRDLQCLTQAVYYEARGETAAGQAAVAQVVLNRARHPAYPKSICGVVFQGSGAAGCQFSFACNGSLGRPVERWAWRRAEKVAARALDGYVMPEVGSATHFHVAGLTPDWRSRLLKVAQVGAHVFYRFGKGVRPAPFTPEAPEAPAVKAEEAKPIYASLSFAPVANAVATSAANAVATGAELVIAAASGGRVEGHKPEVVKSVPARIEPAPTLPDAPSGPLVVPPAAAKPVAALQAVNAPAAS